MIRASAILLFFFLASAPAWAQFDKMLKGLGNLANSGSGLSDAKIGSGLQEALKVGTENAVVQTGTTDGFLMNQAIKILMPKSLQTIEKPLRMVGYGRATRAVVVSLKGRKLGTGQVRFSITLIHPLNPGAPQTRESGTLSLR